MATIRATFERGIDHDGGLIHLHVLVDKLLARIPIEADRAAWVAVVYLLGLRRVRLRSWDLWVERVVELVNVVVVDVAFQVARVLHGRQDGDINRASRFLAIVHEQDRCDGRRT